jgi:deoxycytidylate deaminase
VDKDVSMTLDHWDKKYLSIAKEVSNWSKDVSTQVGAVIADSERRIVAVGFNGFPKKSPTVPSGYRTEAKNTQELYMPKRM